MKKCALATTITSSSKRQAASEEQLLGERFGQDYACYVRRTGRLVPRLWGQAADLHATPNRGGG
jgi:protein-S-isoprenylcysteine O-methyltransferase Ste14